MLTTIALGTRIWVQGELVARLPSGEILVRDGKRVYRGRPLRPCPDQAPAAPAPAKSPEAV